MDKLVKIRDLRKQESLTQKAIAQEMGYGLSTYFQKEQGLIVWTLKDFIYFKNRFNVKIDQIYEFKEIEKKELEKMGML